MRINPNNEKARNVLIKLTNTNNINQNPTNQKSQNTNNVKVRSKSVTETIKADIPHPTQNNGIKWLWIPALFVVVLLVGLLLFYMFTMNKGLMNQIPKDIKDQPIASQSQENLITPTLSPQQLAETKAKEDLLVVMKKLDEWESITLPNLNQKVPNSINTYIDGARAGAQFGDYSPTEIADSAKQAALDGNEIKATLSRIVPPTEIASAFSDLQTCVQNQINVCLALYNAFSTLNYYEGANSMECIFLDSSVTQINNYINK